LPKNLSSKRKESLKNVLFYAIMAITILKDYEVCGFVEYTLRNATKKRGTSSDIPLSCI
jgi:hypothetical protein